MTVGRNDISIEDLISIVKQLTPSDKIKLSKELEKEIISGKLSELLDVFRTSELEESLINEEVEIVRQQIYESKS